MSVLKMKGGSREYRELEAKAQKLAGDRNQAQAILDRAYNSPLTRAINDLSGGVGAVRQQAARQEVAMGLSEVIAASTPQQARQLRQALLAEAKSNPSFSAIPEMIETRLIKDFMVDFVESDVAGQNFRVNMKKFTDFFFPAPGRSNARDVAKEFISPERYRALQKMARGINEMRDYGKIMSMSPSSSQELFTALGVSAGGFKSSGAVYRGLFGNIYKVMANRAHGVLTALVVDKGFANAFARAGGNLTKAINDMPLPRLLQLQNSIPGLQDEIMAIREREASEAGITPTQGQ